MEHTDIERTDNSSVAFLKGWAEAFPEQEWIAGADLRNSPPKPPAVRLKAAKQGWSGSPGKAGASLADSYDIHLECSVDKSGRPLGWLKLHVETLPYNLENQIGCNPNSGSSDCEACRRREAARQRFAALGSDGIGGWEKPSGSGKLTLVQLPLNEISTWRFERGAEIDAHADFLKATADATRNFALDNNQPFSLGVVLVEGKRKLPRQADHS
jgi:hypothetical protein